MTLEECLSFELIEHLRNEQIDAAFLRTPVARQDDLVITPLLDEPMVAALPSFHALAQSGGGRDTARIFPDPSVTRSMCVVSRGATKTAAPLNVYRP